MLLRKKREIGVVSIMSATVGNGVSVQMGGWWFTETCVE